MEGETIKKKYHTILDMLKKERLTFGNQLEGLEAQLKKQDEEIVKLKATHASAIATRDLARQNQHRREIALLSEGKLLIIDYNQYISTIIFHVQSDLILFIFLRKGKRTKTNWYLNLFNFFLRS